MTAATTSPAQRLRAPRAAAIAGIIFSVLLSISLVIIRSAVPAYQIDIGDWISDPLRRNAVRIALQLIPFAGIAFLWFIGVLRNRLGQMEDQFFATVFFGSGLLFVGSLFISAMLAGGLLETMANSQRRQLDTDVFSFVRQVIGASMNTFAIRMAGVFMLSTSTIVFRTAILPRWVAFTGAACALILLLTITNWPWIALLFPLWVLAISTCILMAEARSRGVSTQ
jgi:hypothetical protein